MKVAIYTLGCKVNQYETQAMEQELRRRGHDVVDFSGEADAYVVNSCSVTAVSDQKSRQILHRIRRQHPEAVAALCGWMAKNDKKLFLLGAKPGVAEQAACNLEQAHPGLTVCGTHDGYFKEDAPVVEAIRSAGADVVFVCLGAPKQEYWMIEHGGETGASFLIGLGGSLDVFAGTVKRAPEVWQKLGLEWLYRLLKQPSRIGRMAKLPLFLVSAVKAKGKKG